MAGLMLCIIAVAEKKTVKGEANKICLNMINLVGKTHVHQQVAAPESTVMSPYKRSSDN